jgi:hypothetical protein
MIEGMTGATSASIQDHRNQERGHSSREIFKMHRVAAEAEWRGLGAQ